MADHLWLIGMMGSGKSAAGMAAAAMVDAGFVDTDDVVARRAGCSIAELWGTVGEQAFRQMESAAIIDAEGGEPSVIATGGGAVLDPANVAVMRRSGTIVWLRAAPATLAERVGDGRTRPLLASESVGEDVEQIAAARQAAYTEAADTVIDTDALDLGAVASTIGELWKRS